MNKTSAIRAIIEATSDEPIVFTTGYACRIAQAVADRPNHFYMTGSMGLASSISTGIAWHTGRPTVAVDGDGSLLMNPAGLACAAALPRLPLVHVLLDDGRYASTGGQGVPSASTDFALLARGFGYPRVLRADSPAALAATLRAELATCSAPVFVHCVLSDEDLPVPPRVESDLAEHAARFGAAIRPAVAG